MRILKNRSWNQKIKFPISLCISFFIGSVLGGVITNLLSRELLEQIGSFDLWYEQSDSLIQNLKKRLGQFMMVCLGGMTGFSGIWFYLVFLVMGAGAGVWIATLTLYGGWNIPVCSPHDASVELLWDSLSVFGGRIQKWAGSYEITGLGFDGFVAISWRINRVSDWKNIIAFIGG